MKLTEEHRVKWHEHSAWLKRNGASQTTVSISALEELVGSEQAWREEAESWKMNAESAAEAANHARKYAERLEIQLNQAIGIINKALALPSRGRNWAIDARQILWQGSSILSQEGEKP